MLSCNANSRSRWLANAPRRVIPNLQLTKENEKDGHPQAANLYYSNQVRSTRYNLISFVPAAFFLQFTKVINCFYLVNMILQSIPTISTNAWYYTAIPLCIIIGMGMLKEGLADLKRYQQDRRVNNTPVKKVCLTESNFLTQDLTKSPDVSVNSAEKDLWKLEKINTMDIKVGDIICVKDDETVPADCVLLSTDPRRAEQLGQCFVSTGNLDGERNLKPKMSI